MSRILIGGALLFVSACANSQDLNGDGVADADARGRSPDTVQLIAPSNPIGTVSGMVVNSLQVGIDGVKVTLVLGETGAAPTEEVLTSADGSFSFKGIPAGANGQLLFSKTGYSNARQSVFVPVTGGNIPINNGNGNAGVITLAQLNSSVKYRVYTAAGEPAKGARGMLEVNATAFQTVGGVFGTTIGNYSGMADVDDNGVLTFTGAPDPAEMTRLTNPQFTLTVGALDKDNDGRADFLGSVQGFSAQQLFIQPGRTLVLADARTTSALQILGTNIESLTTNGSPPYRNAVKASDTINIVFNQPITQVDSTRLVKVVQEDCQTNVAVAVVQRAPNILTITPAAAWTLGNRYNIIVRATGLESGTTVDFIGYFFAIDATVPRPLSTTSAFQVRKAAGNMMSNALQPGDTLNVLFDTPITYQGGPQAQAIVNTDLNGDGQIGGMMGVGEFAGPANTGFVITANEPIRANDPANGTFACKASGYSSRWSITITQFPMSNSISSGTGLRVLFPKDNASSDTYQTAWGSPVTTDVNGMLIVVP
jgi:hypothetical protein